jgi:hypothetical protein
LVERLEVKMADELSEVQQVALVYLRIKFELGPYGGELDEERIDPSEVVDLQRRQLIKRSSRGGWMLTENGLSRTRALPVTETAQGWAIEDGEVAAEEAREVASAGVIPLGLAPDPETEEGPRVISGAQIDIVLPKLLGNRTFERLEALDEYFDGIGFKAVLTVLITEAYMDRKAVFLEAGEGE